MECLWNRGDVWVGLCGGLVVKTNGPKFPRDGRFVGRFANSGGWWLVVVMFGVGGTVLNGFGGITSFGGEDPG